MGTFDVFVEGPVDPSPEATRRLAEMMSQRYGLPAADLMARIARGRFRVKGNADRATADTYAHDLEAIGARVTISPAIVSSPSIPVPATPAPTTPTPTAPLATAASSGSLRASGSSLPPQAVARPSSSSLPPQAVARPSSSSLPPQAPRTVTPQPFTSGLSAAFSDQHQPAADLGALGAGAEFSLSSLDGTAESKDAAPASFAPPASTGASTTTSKSGTPSPQKAAPLDLFAPPDAEAAAFVVDLAVDEVQPRERTTTPVSTRAPTPLPIPATPVAPRRATDPSMPSVANVAHAAPPRWRFAAGVLIAIVLGFIPAHLVAAMRERSAFSKIDEHVKQVQLKVGTPDAPIAYDRLDDFRRDQEDRKKTERRNIALISMLIWAAAGGLFAYVWFRRIPWDRQ